VDFKAILNQASDMAKAAVETVSDYIKGFVDFFRPFDIGTTPKQAVVKGAVKLATGLAILGALFVVPKAAAMTLVLLAVMALASVQMYLGGYGLFELIMGVTGLRSATQAE
jgi:galactokinase